ncbi:unnamed protein product [Aureobasidium vineae]|uniref:Uncharacterized protein n=1 Tax=Aureobasidium vineae TaxID=2773715 RepID=A0A9N8K273_9PEZI|nr:unnamed protein product [Aureobasidium vineae]
MSNFSWRPPSVPFEAQTRDGSPFTVWHVCMICQQPRSARYHAEHPIDANLLAVSPPSSVCRRCAPKVSSSPLRLSLPAPQISTPQISAPQTSTPQSLAPQAPTSPSPPSQPELRNIPFRYVEPFVPELQHIEPPPEPAPSAPPVEPSIASTPTIEIMPPHGPSYDEYLVVKRENTRRWSEAPSRDTYPPSARDYPPPSRDHPAPARDPYSAPRQDHSASFKEYFAPVRDNPAPPRDYPSASRDIPPPFQDYSSTISSRPAPVRDYPAPFQNIPSTIRNRPPPTKQYSLPLRERPAPPGNPRPTKRRVSFSGEDEVATLPPDLPSERDGRSMQGLSRIRSQPPNLTGMPSVHDDYEYEKHRNRTYIDPAERPHVPEPKWTPLSESPARELPLVEESYAHGPYRAENSPTPSMQVHVDKDDFVLEKSNESRKAPRQYKPQPAPQDNRTWTRYVTVKEYRDEKGPFVEVEEKFVFDDER